jgi:hypothetical protein
MWDFRFWKHWMLRSGLWDVLPCSAAPMFWKNRLPLIDQFFKNTDTYLPKYTSYLTFVGPCIVIYFHSKTNQMYNISNLFYFGTTFYIVSSLLGVSPASDFWMPMFRNHLSVPVPAFEDGTDRWFRNVGIKKSDVGDTPKKTTHNIQNMTKVWSQEYFLTSLF